MSFSKLVDQKRVAFTSLIYHRCSARTPRGERQCCGEFTCKPPRSVPPTETMNGLMLAFIRRSLICKHCRAAGRHWDADRCSRAGLPSPAWGGGFFGGPSSKMGHLLGFCKNKCVACLLTLSYVKQPESTLQTVSKEGRPICSRVTFEPKRNPTSLAFSPSVFYPGGDPDL